MLLNTEGAVQLAFQSIIHVVCVPRRHPLNMPLHSMGRPPTTERWTQALCSGERTERWARYTVQSFAMGVLLRVFVRNVRVAALWT
jgi:hypothetical protein